MAKAKIQSTNVPIVLRFDRDKHPTCVGCALRDDDTSWNIYGCHAVKCFDSVNLVPPVDCPVHNPQPNQKAL